MKISLYSDALMPVYGREKEEGQSLLRKLYEVMYQTQYNFGRYSNIQTKLLTNTIALFAIIKQKQNVKFTQRLLE